MFMNINEMLRPFNYRAGGLTGRLDKAAGCMGFFIVIINDFWDEKPSSYIEVRDIGFG